MSSVQQSVRNRWWTWELLASGLKASTFLLLAYRFQNELTQFTKPPVNRLRIVLEEHSDVAVLWHVVWTPQKVAREMERRKKWALETICIWRQDLMKTGKRAWRKTKEKRKKRKPKRAKDSTTCVELWSAGTVTLLSSVWVTPMFSRCHYSGGLLGLPCLWKRQLLGRFDLVVPESPVLAS